MKEWQQGYALDDLQRYAWLFREKHRTLVHGAFGLIKERDIASALKDRSIVYARRGPELSAVAIARRLERGSTHYDFAGRPIRLPAGAIFCRAIAAIDPADGLKVIAELSGSGAELWVEIFEEDLTAKAVISGAGLCYRGTKIAAGSEVKGLYSSCEPRLDDHSAFPSRAEAATLEILRPDFLGREEQAEILAELAAYEASKPWAQHYSSYNARHSWTSFALRGYEPGDPGFIIAPREMAAAWKAQHAREMRPGGRWARADWTRASEALPAAMRAIQRIPGGRDRVRFMRLSGGGELTRHADITDRQAGVADGAIARLHIPIRSNPAVTFFAWDARGAKLAKNLPERALCYLDQRKPHAVKNEAPELDRVHMVIDAVSSPELRAWF